MTTTNGSSTATVETLTAEVRVLMVGNRQITLSVAKQLDEVPIAEIEVFGASSWVLPHGPAGAGPAGAATSPVDTRIAHVRSSTPCGRRWHR